MQYKVNFADEEIGYFHSFEYAMFTAKLLSSKIMNEPIMVHSTFFTYTFINGIEK